VLGRNGDMMDSGRLAGVSWMAVPRERRWAAWGCADLRAVHFALHGCS